MARESGLLPVKEPHIQTSREIRLRAVARPDRAAAELLVHLGLHLPTVPRAVQNVVEKKMGCSIQKPQQIRTSPLPTDELGLSLPARWRAVVTTCVYGLGAGASAVAFQLGMNWLYQSGLVRLSHQSHVASSVGSFVLLIASSLIVGWLLNSFCREAAGSGIPQLKLAFWKDFSFVPWRVVWVNFVVGILSVGGGSNLGCERPSRQLGGAVGSNLAALVGEAKQNRRAPTAAGAAAGLSAALFSPDGPHLTSNTVLANAEASTRMRQPAPLA